jgi:hypothetical protein
MDFNEKLNQFGQRIEELIDSIKSEEAAKTSFIMPFFQMLGYDVFNPREFVPEFVADVGIKKGEKVDYAIIVDDQPLILIECKAPTEPLSKHGSQLFRYFGTTAAKFGILTNGVVYRFYTDLEDKNKMDSIPFLEFDLLNLKENLIPEIAKFRKETLDVDTILGAASELKYAQLIKDWLSKQADDPDPEFVKLVMNVTYEGQKNQKAIEKFHALLKRSFNQFINENMNERIRTALRKDPDGGIQEQGQHERSEDEGKQIITTIEELEAFGIVKSILRNAIDANRIFYRDTETYLGILLDNSNRKWICRIYLNRGIKYITIPDENKKPLRFDIQSLNDIYDYEGQIKTSCQKYLETNA